MQVKDWKIEAFNTAYGVKIGVCYVNFRCFNCFLVYCL